MKFLRLFFFLLSPFLLFGLAALLLSLWPTFPPVHACAEKQTIYLDAAGIHLNVVIPWEDMPPLVLERFEADERATYMSIGWGERDFYLNTPTWGDLKARVAARALLWPTASALHLDPVEDIGSDWRAMELCPAQQEALLVFIEGSFKKDGQDRPLLIPEAAYTDDDRFFEARRSYWLAFTCNNWVNKGLKKAEVKTAVWSPFKEGILLHLK